MQGNRSEPTVTCCCGSTHLCAQPLWAWCDRFYVPIAPIVAIRWRHASFFALAKNVGIQRHRLCGGRRRRQRGACKELTNVIAQIALAGYRDEAGSQALPSQPLTALRRTSHRSESARRVSLSLSSRAQCNRIRVRQARSHRNAAVHFLINVPVDRDLDRRRVAPWSLPVDQKTTTLVAFMRSMNAARRAQRWRRVRIAGTLQCRQRVSGQWAGAAHKLGR